MESELGVDERGLAGTRWRVVRVRFKGRQHATESMDGARLHFAADGDFFGYDGANWSSGRWLALEDQLIVTDVITTLRAYVGEDASRQALISAMSSVLIGPEQPVRYAVDHDVLTLWARDVEIHARTEPLPED